MYLHQIWHRDSKWGPGSSFVSKFASDKIRDGGGRFLKFYFNGDNLVAIARIFTKFDGETENEAPHSVRNFGAKYLGNEAR